MSNTIESNEISLEEIFGQAMQSSVITSEDRNILQKMMLERPLTQDEAAILNRLLYNVRRGWVKALD